MKLSYLMFICYLGSFTWPHLTRLHQCWALFQTFSQKTDYVKCCIAETTVFMRQLKFHSITLLYICLLLLKIIYLQIYNRNASFALSLGSCRFEIAQSWRTVACPCWNQFSHSYMCIPFLTKSQFIKCKIFSMIP